MCGPYTTFNGAFLELNHYAEIHHKVFFSPNCYATELCSDISCKEGVFHCAIELQGQDWSTVTIGCSERIMWDDKLGAGEK
jgi:hypothetical protein